MWGWVKPPQGHTDTWGLAARGFLAPRGKGQTRKGGFVMLEHLCCMPLLLLEAQKRPLRAARAGSCLLCVAFQSIILSN